MLDYTNKQFIRSFCVSDVRQERMASSNVIINGRNYIKLGKYCATTLVANLFKVYDCSINQFKYVYFVGAAKQHPNDISVKYSDGVEIAAENAMTNPCMVLTFDEPISYEAIEELMWRYISYSPVKYVRTRKEIENLSDNNCFKKIKSKILNGK